MALLAQALQGGRKPIPQALGDVLQIPPSDGKGDPLLPPGVPRGGHMHHRLGLRGELHLSQLGGFVQLVLEFGLPPADAGQLVC